LALLPRRLSWAKSISVAQSLSSPCLATILLDIIRISAKWAKTGQDGLKRLARTRAR